MLKLIEKGMTREEAYDLVQPKTAYSWDNQVDFKPLLEEDTKVTSCLTQEEIDELFNPIYYTKRVDDIFERLGLENKKIPLLVNVFLTSNGIFIDLKGINIKKHT